MPTTVGVIGGGQLARMMIPPAIELGLEIKVLGEGEGSSARAAVTAIGDAHDVQAVLAFARDVDVITFDHEHVPQAVLRALLEAGAAVHPGPEALRFAQDKLEMRARLSELGIPMPGWAGAASVAEVDAFLADHGGRAVAKTPRGGYDGKGVRVISDGAEAADWLEEFGVVLVEELVDFRRELAQLVARRPSGEMRLWPVVETIQREGVCAEVIAPAPGTERDTDTTSARAVEIAERIGTGVGVTGVLAVELFETADGRLLVNELAMRPHNSGHWTIDGSTTSQFEQHLRAVLDLPLGDPALRAPCAVMVNLLGGPQGEDIVGRFPRAMAAEPGAKLHTYGKSPRPGRKVGHVTVVGERVAEVTERARRAAACFDDAGLGS